VSPILSTFSLGSRAQIRDLTMTYVAATTSTTRSFTVPASAQAGDFVMYATSSGFNSGDGDTSDSYLPSGWTRLYRLSFDGGTGEDSVHDRAYKFITSGDVSSSFNVAATDHAAYSIVALVFRPSKTCSVTIEDSQGGGSTGDPASQNINGTAVSTLPHLLLATYFAYDGSVTGRSWTGGTFTEESPAARFYTRYKMFAIGDTTENVTVDMGESGQHGHLYSTILSFS